MDVHVDGEAIEEWRRSYFLIFVLLCLNQEVTEGDRAGVVEAFNKQCLWDQLLSAEPTRKRRREEEERDEEEGEGEEGRNWNWSAVLNDPGNVASAALKEGVVCLYESDAAEKMRSLAIVFLQCSAARIAKQILKDEESEASDRNEFLTLSVTGLLGIVNDDDEKIQAIVSAAESEAGQQIIRDMSLSLLLPPLLVGVRKSLVLERAKSTRATVDHAEIVQRSHELAMQGAEWTYANSTDELDKTIILLSGLALLTTKGEDVLRKADAFKGRLQLPFLETIPPSVGVRAILIPSENRWVLFRLRRGVPEILASKKGIEGLKAVCLELTKN